MKSTAHIDPQAPIAPTVLMPGDPLRAKFIAENYLEDAEQFNSVRNMLGFTGTYQGTPVSVMGSGMGIPSISLYAWELIHVFDCKRLIRVGTCGALQEGINLYDVVIAQAACSNSAFMDQYNLPGTYAPIGSASSPRARASPRTWATSCPRTPSTTPTRPSTTAGRRWASWPSRWRPRACTPRPPRPASRRSASSPSPTPSSPAR